MRRVFRRAVYLVAGIALFGALLPDEESGRFETPPSSSIVKPSTVTALPNEPAKEALIASIPRPASLQNQQPVRRADQAPSYVYVTGSRVNLRLGPGTSNKRIGAFDRGTKLVVLESQGGWTRVSGSVSGVATTGWMSSDYLGKSRPAVRTAVPAPAPKRSISVPSTSEVSTARRSLISQSLAVYPGNCPCPYNVDRAGRRCGQRSAWSKPGGRSPLCYDSDITRSHLAAYFKRMGRNYP